MGAPAPGIRQGHLCFGPPYPLCHSSDRGGADRQLPASLCDRIQGPGALKQDYKRTTINPDGKGGGMSVISYRTKMDRKTIEKFAVQKLKYRSVNAFIDHAVQKTLLDELGAGS